ncbi:MAG TPA: efflux RND transporter periplasmic adaptor subunit [Candidatus Omnitrophota bacterium]|nr:efflux RND transporter periplasmic adaptor subunit [Candidatus Omnitrophota bacterium]
MGVVSGCKPRDAMPPQGAEVAVVTLQTERLAITNELPGRTSAFLVAEIRPQVNGIVLKRFFTEGSDVKAGDELYQIDPAPFQAVLERSEANLVALRARVSRYKEALADKAVSQQAFDDANAALKQAEAELKVARINLDYTHIVSPISGRIGASTVTEGGIVTAYQPVALATVQQLDPIYVNVPQSANDLLRFQRSFKNGILNRDKTQKSTVLLILGDGTPYAFQGTLQFKDVTVDPTTGSVILRTVFPNPENILLPGMFVRAIITEGVMEQAILVPQQGVAQTPKGESVALVVGDGEKVEQRMLTLDRAVGDKWLVSSGLQPGDRVIVEGLQRTRPGAVVKVVPFEPGQKNDPAYGKNVSSPQ